MSDVIVDELAEGERLKEEGMARALSNPRVQRWVDLFYLAVFNLPNGKEFTSEDIVDIIGLPSGGTMRDKNNAVGGGMAGAKSKGWIVRSGKYTKSKHKHSHATEIPIWVRVYG